MQCHQSLCFRARSYCQKTPYFFKGCGKVCAGEGRRKGVVADGHSFLWILHAELAMGKGPYFISNRVAAGHQLLHITDNWDGKRSTSFHASNWEMISHWILNYLQELLGPSVARTLHLYKS